AALTNQLTLDFADFHAKWRTTNWGAQTNWETMVEECNRIADVFLQSRWTYLNAVAELPASQPAYVPLLIRRLDVSPAGGNQDQEYIELVNTNTFAVDISEWSISNAVTFSFIPGTVIPAGSNLFVSAGQAAFRMRSTSPKSNELAFVTGPYEGHLSSWGEAVELWNDTGVKIAETNYPSNPSAWQRDLRITEIMYAPSPPPKGAAHASDFEYEWIELANLGTNALDLNGVSLTAGVSFRFTNSLVLPAGGRVAVVRNCAAFVSRYDTNGIVVAGDFTDVLDDAGDTIKLDDPSNETILEFTYSDEWDARTDGEGWALVQTNPAASHISWGGKANWAANPIWQGTPGRGEPEWPPETIAINEWLPHSDTAQDWVEFHNTSTQPVDISGWWISDSLAVPRKFVIPAGTVLTGGAFTVFTEAQFNNAGHPGCIVPFAFSELGEEVHLTAASNGAALTYRHSLAFEAADRDVTFGRHTRSDGRVVYPAMAAPTPDQANSAPHNGPAVISEILYLPCTNGIEFVEIYATTSGIVRLYDPAAPTNLWKLTGGISYVFPANSALTGGQYAIVCGGDPGAFRASNGIPAHVQVFGPFEGALDAAGERIRLRKPGSPEADGFVPYVLVEEIEYDDDPPWPAAGCVGGRSIERVNPAWFGNDPAHWRAGLPAGAPGAPLTGGDSDGDGIPDEWEIECFGDIGPPGHGPDRDGNGRPDGDQFIDGSGVSNSAGAVEIAVSNAVPPLVTFVTRPTAGAGYQGRTRMYSFEWTSSLASNAWNSVPGCDRIQGSGQTVMHTNEPADPVRLYRVRSWLEDPP
ncbi:MAG: lamin tail domain-containing protein, partial [Verrucomicrobia bacterium]|nr:lamin tail domain-containing protein [Verrucomicrobiota bacterium]